MAASPSTPQARRWPPIASGQRRASAEMKPRTHSAKSRGCEPCRPQQPSKLCQPVGCTAASTLPRACSRPKLHRRLRHPVRCSRAMPPMRHCSLEAQNPIALRWHASVEAMVRQFLMSAACAGCEAAAAARRPSLLHLRHPKQGLQASHEVQPTIYWPPHFLLFASCVCVPPSLHSGFAFLVRHLHRRLGRLVRIRPSNLSAAACSSPC